MSVINKNISSFEQSRRQFFSKILPAGALCCFGCSACYASAQSEKKHKFMEDSGMSFQQVFDFSFKEFYIPITQNLAKEIGKDEFIEMLKRAGSELRKQQGQNLAQSLGKNDIASLAAWTKENDFYKHILTSDIVEETDKAFEMKNTECLLAKTFREADASDIGYASLCYGEYAWTSAFNPKMKFISTKTLMQGHDFCNARYVLEG